MEDTRAFRKTRVGTVVSNKMDKTIVVAIEDSVQHALYKKTTMSAASVIPSVSWRPVPCPRTSAGDW